MQRGSAPDLEEGSREGRTVAHTSAFSELGKLGALLI